MTSDQGPLGAPTPHEPSAQFVEALASLDPEEREAILEAFYSGTTYRDVAAASGIPAEVISARIRAGLLRIEKALRGPGSTQLS